MSRTMPLAGDYAAAVQNPGFCFTDEVLRGSVIRKNNLGQPRAMSGQFSVVFPMTSPDGNRHAVKCFTHDAPNQLRRYELIYEGLSRLRPRWATDFAYLEDGIRIEGESYPVLRLDWVEGTSLLGWLDAHQNAADIARLADEFGRLVRELAGAGIAHGDLQHGNILVQPDGTLRLIDYDGIYLPGIGLEEYPSDETGLPDYQPPGRAAADYGPAMDRFSAWLISLSLEALSADPPLLDVLNPERGEYLLLDRDDFADPWYSDRVRRLDAHADPRTRELADRMRILLALPLSQMPDPASAWSYDGPLPQRPPRPLAPRKPVKPPWLANARPVRPRPLPSAERYTAAVRTPRRCFTDGILRESLVWKDREGRPHAMPGRFSVVFSATSPGSERYAVKCFTRDAPHRGHRYELIAEGLTNSGLWLPWVADFDYIADGIQVAGDTYPVLQMNWVEGASLTEWIEKHPKDWNFLQLSRQFRGLTRELAQAGIAHGNLCPDNIIVRPDGSLRLIDYDSMYVPGVGLEQYPSQEVGLPGFQPPSRTAADYGPAMDRFSAWLIVLSLEALAEDPALIDVLNRARGDYLLLNRDDFADPASSPSLALLDEHWSPAARRLADQVRSLLTLSMSEMPDPAASWRHQGPVQRSAPRALPARPQPSSLHRRAALSIVTAVAAAVVLVVVIGMLSSGSGNHNGSNSSGSSTSYGLGDGTDFLLGDGQIFDAGSDGSFTTVSYSSGRQTWVDNDDAVVPTSNLASYSVPQMSDNCVVIPGYSSAAVVRPGTRAHYVVPGVTGAIASQGRVAWSNGTVTNLCTGKLLSRAGRPSGFAEPECLLGSMVLWQAGSRGVQAWENGKKVWSDPGHYDVACDSDGTVALLDDDTYTVRLIDPRTGKPLWKTAEPGCPPADSSECVNTSAFQASVEETPGVVILSGPEISLAFDKATGKPLWHRDYQCVLAVHDTPKPEALIGPCNHPGGTDVNDVDVLNPESGTVIKRLSLGSGDYDQWTANANEILAVNGNDGAVRELTW